MVRKLEYKIWRRLLHIRSIQQFTNKPMDNAKHTKRQLPTKRTTMVNRTNIYNIIQHTRIHNGQTRTNRS